MTKQLNYSNEDRQWTATVVVKGKGRNTRTYATVIDLTTGAVYEVQSRYLDTIHNVIERTLWTERHGA